MAYTTINKHTDYFNTKLYTGNGATNAITGVGHQPDFTWIKDRDNLRNHVLNDAVRGATKNIFSNTNDAEATDTSTLTAFNSDGFTLGSGTKVNGSSINFVSWNWKAGTTGSGTTTGSGYGKAYSYSVNTTSGFSIVKYIGNGTGGHTIPHHLGATPGVIIVKNLDTTDDWVVYHHKNTDAPGTDYLTLNSTAATGDSSGVWNDASPSSTVFTVGTAASVNGSDNNLIAYVFAEKVGYSKFGSYVGNGNNDGTFIHTGFRPEFSIIKPTSTTGNWQIHDTKRDGYNVKNDNLAPNNTAAEADNQFMDIVSNGFKLRSSTYSASGVTYVYLAFGQSIVSSTNIVANAR